MKRYYIAYGSNLSQEQMARRCPTAKIVGTTTLKDWRLLFNGPASIERKEGYEVPVLIWEIMPTDEKSLDRYEGYPSYYRKEMLDIEIFRYIDKLIPSPIIFEVYFQDFELSFLKLKLLILNYYNY